MAEVYGLADWGATNTRIAIFDADGFPYSVTYTATDPEDYEGSVQRVADTMRAESEGRGELVATSVAIAAQVNQEGVLTKAGGLKNYLGRNFQRDMAAALGLDPEFSGVMGDVVAAAKSQEYENRRNGKPISGYASTLSSGWGGAGYSENGELFDDEPGHEHLRDGQTCPCGESGHAEAFISGNGVQENHNVPMKEWLMVPANQGILVTDISTAVIDMIERHRADRGFEPEEIRWTGGIALNQPFILFHRVAGEVKRQLGTSAPAFDPAAYGEQAGIHGTFIDAKERAEAY